MTILRLGIGNLKVSGGSELHSEDGYNACAISTYQDRGEQTHIAVITDHVSPPS